MRRLQWRDYLRWPNPVAAALVIKPISRPAANWITSRSVAAIQSQSAGFFESVFLGKQHPFLEDGLKKEIAHRPLLRQARRRDRHQGE